MELWVATRNGIVQLHGNERGWVERARSLEGRQITAISAAEGVLLAGTVDRIYRSSDGGESWEEASGGLTERHVRWLATHSGYSGLVLAGTEPAAIYLSEDSGNTWTEKPEVAALRDKYEWMLPYSPEDGCIRGFASHGERIYAAAEVGGLLRSDDRGQRWALAPGSPGRLTFQPTPGEIHSDVHSVAVHASNREMVLAPTGGGLFRSDDGGATWRNLYRCYCRAAWWDPADAAHIVFGPADGVDRGGRFAESFDGGATWTEGPERWGGHMVERLTAVDGALFAVLSDGSWLRRAAGEEEWEPMPDAGWVTALTSVR